MDSVLISIRPRWCEEIFSGRKNVELRKTWPTNLELPFRAYVYCTAPEQKVFDVMRKGDLDYLGNRYEGDKPILFKMDKYSTPMMCCRTQKVVGEIWVGRILEVDWHDGKSWVNGREVMIEDEIRTSVTVEEFLKYKGNGKVYGWQIYGHTYYKEPKPLTDFGMKRPPQSWCYVKEETND